MSSRRKVERRQGMPTPIVWLFEIMVTQICSFVLLLINGYLD